MRFEPLRILQMPRRLQKQNKQLEVKQLEEAGGEDFFLTNYNLITTIHK